MHAQNGTNPQNYIVTVISQFVCATKNLFLTSKKGVFMSLYTRTGVWSPHPPPTPTTSGQEIGWNEQIHRQHARSCVNQSLARSQRWGRGVAQDDVTENTICQPLSHCLRSLFLVRLYFRNNKTCAHTGIHSPQGICSQTFISVTHHCKSTHTDTHTHPQQIIYHPLMPLTVLITYRCSVGFDLLIICHLHGVDRIVLICFIGYWSSIKTATHQEGL